MDGNAGWDCARWSKPLSLAEQDEGCPVHLHIPQLIPGEVIDSDESAETITYRLHTGVIWTDGAHDEAA